MSDVHVVFVDGYEKPIVVPEEFSQTTDRQVTWHVNCRREKDPAVKSVTITFEEPPMTYFRPEPTDVWINGQLVAKSGLVPTNTLTKELDANGKAFFFGTAPRVNEPDTIRNDKYSVEAEFVDGTTKMVDPRIRSTDP